jgi:hypothetical protein
MTIPDLTKLPDTVTLGRAREDTRKYVDEGVRCPCCTQFAKVYKRKINSGMARTLIHIYRNVAVGETFHLPTVIATQVSPSKHATSVSWWGLLEPKPGDGNWALTDNGRRFVEGYISFPKYAHLYDGKVLRFSGDQVDIKRALGARFDYAELMAA